MHADQYVVSEEEVAKDLGYADVYELRRAQTELGSKNEELAYELTQARCEAARFRAAGMRMAKVLEKVKGYLQYDPTPTTQAYVRLLLAIEVVNNRAVDWDHELDDWFN